MYVVTARPQLGQKGNNRILMMAEHMDYMENGYPRLIEPDVAFPNNMVFVNGELTDGKVLPEGLKEIPEEVELEKWCYTKEKGFYENPDYVEPTVEK